MEERSVLPKLMELKSLFLSILQETPKYKKSRQMQIMHYSIQKKNQKRGTQTKIFLYMRAAAA
jgi:hypothetical protein